MMDIWHKQKTTVTTEEHACPPTTVAEALTVVGDAIRSHARDGSGLGQVRSSVRVLCVFARKDGLRPEELLVQLKHALSGIRELDALGLEKRDAIRSRVVELAIQLYFSDGS